MRTDTISVHGVVGPSYGVIDMYKNGLEIPQSRWSFQENSGALNDNLSVVGSRSVVSNIYLIVSSTLEDFLNI